MAVVQVTASVEFNFTTGPQTGMQLLAAANHKVKITEIGISGQGVSNTDAPLNVQLLRQTTSGTCSASTEVLLDADAGVTIQTVATEDCSSEPTAGDILHRWFIHPQAGMVWVPPPGTEPIISTIARLGVRILDTPTAALDINLYMKWLE